MDEDEEEDKQETEKAVLKLPPSLGDILSKKQNGSIDDDAQEIRNNKLPVLDDQIKDYEEDFPNDKEKRGNIRSCYDFFTWVISDSCLFSIN